MEATTGGPVERSPQPPEGRPKPEDQAIGKSGAKLVEIKKDLTIRTLEEKDVCKDTTMGPILQKVVAKVNEAIGRSRDIVLSQVREEKEKGLGELIGKITDHMKKGKEFDRYFVFTVADDAGDSHKFQILYEKEGEKIHLLFKDSLVSMKHGQYKTPAHDVEISSAGIVVRRHTTEKPLTDDISMERERRTLEECQNIPGIAKTYLISLYHGKDAIKQRLIQKFYPGGDLQQAIEEGSLTIEEKENIAYRLCKTLAAFHNHKLAFSHNDLRPDNIVLDKNKNPILTDFGGTTTKDDDKIGTGSIQYMPPEMVDRNLIKRNERLEEEEVDYMGRLDRLEEELETVEETERREKIEEKIEVVKFDLNEIEEEMEDVMHAIACYIREKSNYIRQKNDNYALGLTLEKLFGTDPTPRHIQKIKDGLLREYPNERFTSQEAFELFPQKKA